MSSQSTSTKSAMRSNFGSLLAGSSPDARRSIALRCRWDVRSIRWRCRRNTCLTAASLTSWPRKTSTMMHARTAVACMPATM
eukprot:10770454-Heterocapsa_arctica.AAC.1